MVERSDILHSKRWCLRSHCYWCHPISCDGDGWSYIIITQATCSPDTSINDLGSSIPYRLWFQQWRLTPKHWIGDGKYWKCFLGVPKASICSYGLVISIIWGEPRVKTVVITTNLPTTSLENFKLLVLLWERPKQLGAISRTSFFALFDRCQKWMNFRHMQNDCVREACVLGVQG